ncbi:MAG: 30S ribosomal protein S3ae [Thermoplasmatota archaeon]
MARRQTTREAKKLKDKWKAKQWYTIVAPDMFNRAQIGETLSDEPQKLIGRNVEVTLQDLTGDFRMMHVKLRFKIIDYSSSEAFTRFIGHDLTSDYIRRQTRRKRTKMEGVFDVKTKDGFTVRIKPMAISDKRIQSSVQYILRRKMKEIVDDAGSKHTFSELIKYILTTERDKSLVSQILTGCRTLYPLKRVDIRRVEVLAYPEGADMDAGMSSEPVPVEEQADSDSAEAPAEETEEEPIGDSSAE